MKIIPQVAYRKSGALMLLAIYMVTALGIASLPLGRAKAAAPTGGDTSGLASDFGITTSTDPKDVTYTAEWLDAAHLKVKIGVKGVYTDKFVIFEPNADNDSAAGSAPLVGQINDAHSTINYHVENWGGGQCTSEVHDEFQGSANYKRIKHITINIDFSSGNHTGCDINLGGGVGVDVDPASVDMSIAYFRWVDDSTIEPVASMHIDESGGVNIADLRDIDPEFKTVEGEDQTKFRDTTELPQNFCVDYMTVNRAANTLKFYDLFDKKSATGNWYDVYSTIPGADVKNTDGCAMLSNRSIEQNLSGDDVTIPYLNYDTIIANKADSKKKGISAKPVTGINNAASPTPKSADMLCSDNSGVLGWVLCPVLKLLDGAINWVEGQIKDFLFIDPSHFSRTGTDGGTSGLYKAWSTFRGIATVVIVIIALLMIFSEAMGQGIFDNYSVKKILPKLLLAGIAIQLSWFLMTSLVNIFNIIGDGIGGLMLQPFTTNGKPIGDSIVSVLPPTDTKGGLLVGIVGGIAIVGLIIGLVGFGIAILAALFTGFITLVIRTMIIYLGIVFAPLGIAMSILPGTQKASKWWWESFEKALMLYPLVVALIAAGKITSWLLVQADKNKAGEVGGLYMIAAIAAWYAPFFFIPKAFQMGGAALGKLTGFTNDKSKGIFDKARGFNDARKKAKGQYARDNAFNRQQQWWAKGRANPLNAVGKAAHLKTRTGAYLEAGTLGFGKQSKVARQTLEANAAAARVKTNSFDLEAQKASLEAKEVEIATQNATAKLNKAFLDENETAVKAGYKPLDQREWLRVQVTKNGATGSERTAVINRLTEMKATEDLRQVAEFMIDPSTATEDSKAAWATSMVQNKQSIKSFAPDIAEARVAPEAIKDSAGNVIGTRPVGIAYDKLFDSNLKAEDIKGWSPDTWKKAVSLAPTHPDSANLVSAATSLYKNQNQWDSVGAGAQKDIETVLLTAGPLPTRTW